MSNRAPTGIDPAKVDKYTRLFQKESFAAANPEWTREQIEQYFIALDVPQAQPEPLRREHPPAEPFPIDALGEIGEGAARRMHEVIQAPDAICAQSVLAGMTLAAQAHADISIDSRVSPLSCYFTSIAATGERKSAVDKVAIAPHYEYERRQADQYKLDYTQYENELIAWKQTRDEQLKKAKSRATKMQVMDELGPEPWPPLEPTIVVTEPTFEGLIKLMQISQPSIGLFTDEGGQFIGGHALNSENALKTASGLSLLWDNGQAKRTRGGDGNSTLYGRRFSMHLMIQPVVAEKLLTDDLLKGQGLVSRMLCCWPTSTVGSRPYQAIDLSADPEIKRYWRRMTELLSHPLPLREGTTNELQPHALRLSPGAKALWVRFHDYCDREAADGGELENVRGLANKMAEHACRMAGVLSVVHDQTNAVISSQWIECGIKLASYYLTEALRIESAGATDLDIVLAEELIAFFHTKKMSLVYPAPVYQRGPSRLRKKADALRILRLLEDHGWLHPINEPIEIDGKVRKEAWRMVK